MYVYKEAAATIATNKAKHMTSGNIGSNPVVFSGVPSFPVISCLEKLS